MDPVPLSGACWACQYRDLEDKNDCRICSSSSSITKSEYIDIPDRLDSQHIPTATTLSLMKLRQSTKDDSPEWFAGLQSFRDLDSRRLARRYHRSSQESPDELPITITLQWKNPLKRTPSITVTSTSNSPSTMNLTTWATFDYPVWSATKVRVALMISERKKHTPSQECSRCVKTAIKDFKYRLQMTGTEIPTDLRGFWTDRVRWEKRLEREKEERENEKRLDEMKAKKKQARKDSVRDESDAHFVEQTTKKIARMCFEDSEKMEQMMVVTHLWKRKPSKRKQDVKSSEEEERKLKFSEEEHDVNSSKKVCDMKSEGGKHDTESSERKHDTRVSEEEQVPKSSKEEGKKVENPATRIFKRLTQKTATLYIEGSNKTEQVNVVTHLWRRKPLKQKTNEGVSPKVSNGDESAIAVLHNAGIPQSER